MEEKLGRMHQDMSELQKSNYHLQSRLDVAMSQLLTLDTIKHSTKRCMFYTGLLCYEIFISLLKYFVPRAKEMCYWSWEKKATMIVVADRKKRN